MVYEGNWNNDLFNGKGRLLVICEAPYKKILYDGHWSQQMTMFDGFMTVEGLFEK